MSQPKLPSDTFCILPWIHFYHDPDGKIAPCCSAEKSVGHFGSVQEFGAVSEVMNTDSMKTIRVEMLEGKKPKACANCYREEYNGVESFRQSKNFLAESVDLPKLLENTDADGTIHDFKLRYWDVRFSNICNFSCRMCGPNCSHSWGPDSVKLLGHQPKKNYVISAFGQNASWDDVINRYGDLSELEEIYFGGGEVLFQSEHWHLLEHLVQIGVTDKPLTYITNLSKLKYSTYDLKKYLEQFSNVLIIVSMDGISELGEYIRHGLDWPTMIDNLTTVTSFSGVQLRFNSVISAYNILNIDSIMELADQYQAPVDFSICHYPEELNITNLPQELKDLAKTRILNHRLYHTFQNDMDGLISFMMQQPVSTWQKFCEYTNKLDNIRNQNVLTVVPEFVPHWK